MKKYFSLMFFLCGLCLLAGCTGGYSTSTSPPPPATHFSVTAPAAATAGTAFQITVTALDASNNVVANYSGTALFSSSDTQAVLPSNQTLMNGTGTFSVTFKTATGQTITATAGSIAGTSSTINVSAGPATHLSVNVPNASTAGMAFNFTVTAFDTFGNVATGYSGTVHLSSSDTQAVLPPNSALISGARILSATLNTITNTTITATDAAASLSASSNPISVFSNAATHFFVATPINVITRAPVNVIVTALDGANNASVGYAGTIHFTSTDGKAILAADSLLANGQQKFSATLETAGNQTIAATDTVKASVTGTSSSIAVSAATVLTITSAAPPNGTAGVNYETSTTEYLKCVLGGPRPGPTHWVCSPCTPGVGGTCGSWPRCYTHSPCLLVKQIFVHFTFQATGGVPPYGWSASFLPPGLIVNSQNGQITGTPTLAGTYNIGATAADSGSPQATTNANYPIIISNPPPPVIKATPTPTAGAINLPYSFTFTATGGLSPLHWSATDALPPGLRFDSASGLLSGQPTATGSFPLTVTVQDAAGQNSASQSFTIQIFAHGFTPTGSLVTERLLHTATLLNSGKVLIAGGQKEGGIALATAELYDPATGSFASTGSMGAARTFHTATLLNNGKVLVTGGNESTGDLVTAEIFDPATGSFMPTGSMTTARSWHTATLLTNGKVLITGGLDSGTFLATAELYDPTTGSFASTVSMGTERMNQTATLLNDGKVLVAGGRNGTGSVATAELFDPATGTFSATGAMGTSRSDQTATLLISGKVLVTGGLGATGSALTTAELFDPTAQSFMPTTGRMGTARAIHTATMLNDGTVLAAGGQDSIGNAITEAELFDPASGSFSGTGGLGTAREFHTATLLKDGRVLVVGGRIDNGAGALATAEVYQ
jgi:hypothetical protein